MARSLINLSPPSPAVAAEEQEKVIEEVLTYPISLCEMIREAAKEADSFKSECIVLKNLAEDIANLLRSVVRIVTSTSPSSLYDRPIRQILVEVSRNLEKAFALARKCRRRSIFRRVMTIVTATDFKKVQFHLENSMADVKWLVSLYDGYGGIDLSLPPIACNDPIMSWVWSFISTLYSGQIHDKVEAANELASLAKDNDRNKKIIVDEGGVLPLLKLLKDGSSSVELQMAAGETLLKLANHEDRVYAIVKELGVPIVVKVFDNSPMRVQVILANLVARMAEHSRLAQEGFARENVIKPLVTLLLMDVFIDDPKFHSIDSIVKNNKDLETNLTRRLRSSAGVQPSSGSYNYKYGVCKEDEKPEVKLKLKISCADALWMLAKGSVVNSKRITETKGLLCLAKIVETEQRGELLVKCLMAIMEITASAESDVDLRRSAFKINSPPAKAVVNQLLMVITKYNNPDLQIPAIRAIGYLSRTFPAREIRVIEPLVKQLSHKDQSVATEAAIALEKFVSPDNHLCKEHAKTIIDFKGVSPLAKLCRGNEKAKMHGLVLLCYLVLHARNSEALEQPWVSNAVAGADRVFIAQHPELRELIEKAIGHVNVFHSGVLNVFQSGVLNQKMGFST